MSVTKESIRESLRAVTHPLTKQDVVACGAIKKVAVCDGFVSVTLAAGTADDQVRAALKEKTIAAIREAVRLTGDQLAEVHVEVTSEDPANTAAPTESAVSTPSTSSPSSSPSHTPILGLRSHPKPGENPAGGGGAAGPPKGAVPASSKQDASTPSLPGVKHIIAVGAGKGGVGKSTIAVNLAVGLARLGHAVGLMDGDIYGPSIPTMLGLDSLETAVMGGMLQPFLVHGIKTMTIGKLVEPGKPLIWRGPMAHGAFKQLVEQTNWGELDYLIIDLPPGTGDVSLTMAQLLKLTGAVVVCTPQKVAQDDAVRAAKMYQQLGIEVLGVVENMSYFIGDDDKEYDIFGKGGAQRMAERLGLPFLGAVPITMSLRENSDKGTPTANFTDRSPRGTQLAAYLERVVSNLENQVAMSTIRAVGKRPTLKIS